MLAESTPAQHLLPLAALPGAGLTTTAAPWITIGFADARRTADPRAWGCDLFDDGIEEAAEYEVSTNNRMARYEHDPSRVDALLAQVAGVNKTHAFADALGSVYGLVDASGATKARYSYDVYGARAAAAEDVATGWGFTGRRHDPTGGLAYYRERYYDTTAGRFQAPDPAADELKLWRLGSFEFGALALEKYQYVSGRPTGFRDPSGLFKIGWHRGLVFFGILQHRIRNGFDAKSPGAGLVVAGEAANEQYWIDLGPLSQLVDNHQHAMRDFGESAALAELQWRAYKASRLVLAKQAVCERRWSDAGEHIGEALHAVQDHIAHPRFGSWADHTNQGWSTSDTYPSEEMLGAASTATAQWLSDLERAMR